MKLLNLAVALGAAALVAGCASVNPVAVLSEKDPRVTVELLQTECKVDIALMIFSMNGSDEPKAAVTVVDETEIQACWGDINGGIGIMDENGNGGILPKNKFSPEPK